MEFTEELRALSSRPCLPADRCEYSAAVLFYALMPASSCPARGRGLMKLAEKNANKMRAMRISAPILLPPSLSPSLSRRRARRRQRF